MNLPILDLLSTAPADESPRTGSDRTMVAVARVLDVADGGTTVTVSLLGSAGISLPATASTWTGVATAHVLLDPDTGRPIHVLGPAPAPKTGPPPIQTPPPPPPTHTHHTHHHLHRPPRLDRHPRPHRLGPIQRRRRRPPPRPQPRKRRNRHPNRPGHLRPADPRHRRHKNHPSHPHRHRKRRQPRQLERSPPVRHLHRRRSPTHRPPDSGDHRQQPDHHNRRHRARGWPS